MLSRLPVPGCCFQPMTELAYCWSKWSGAVVGTCMSNFRYHLQFDFTSSTATTYDTLASASSAQCSKRPWSDPIGEHTAISDSLHQTTDVPTRLKTPLSEDASATQPCHHISILAHAPPLPSSPSLSLPASLSSVYHMFSPARYPQHASPMARS